MSYQTELRNKNRGYMNLIVWQKAMDLFELAWDIAYKEAKIDFKLRSQFADAVQSISSNISEGYGRRSVMGGVSSRFCAGLLRSRHSAPRQTRREAVSPPVTISKVCVKMAEESAGGISGCCRLTKAAATAGGSDSASKPIWHRRRSANATARSAPRRGS